MSIDPVEVLPDDNEVLPAPLALRRDVPVDLADLAALKSEAIEIIDARVQVVVTMRTAAIRMTHPSDWILFKADNITGYLQDGGCDRVRDLFGIEVFGVGKPERIAGTEPGTFHYLIAGSGRCKVTGQTIEAIEGGRSSTDDFCKGKTGAELELLVRKAARANLDGNITRELAGLKSVPIEELARAWAGTPKTTDQCIKGRGFGTKAERLGATRAGVPDVPPPICPTCKTPGTYRPASGNRAAFYGCKNWEAKGHPRWTPDAADWVASQQQPATPAQPAPPISITADDIPFGREPGTEG